MGQSFFSNTARNDQLAALATDLNAGKLIIYDGPQPANADTAVGGSNHALATFALPNPAAAVAAGILTMNAIAAVAVAIAGVANWFRLLKSDSVTVLGDGNIGNQTVTLTAQANATATALTVSGLTLPLYAGQDLIFSDGGVLKKASVSANVAAGVTAVPVTALAQTIANGSTTVQNATLNSPNLQVNAQASISSCTITAPAAGT